MDKPILSTYGIRWITLNPPKKGIRWITNRSSQLVRLDGSHQVFPIKGLEEPPFLPSKGLDGHPKSSQARD